MAAERLRDGIIPRPEAKRLIEEYSHLAGGGLGIRGFTYEPYAGNKAKLIMLLDRGRTSAGAVDGLPMMIVEIPELPNPGGPVT